MALSQSRAAGWCAFSFSILVFRSLWQFRQRSGLVAKRSLSILPCGGCGNWYILPLSRLCLDFPPFYAFYSSSWQEKQSRTLLIDDHSFNIAPVAFVARQTFPFCKRVMVGAARLCFHEVPVALGAHFRAG